jgi:hypothetical protein
MLVKLGVYGLDKLHISMRLVLKYVAEVWGNEEPVITSCAEGTHGSGSFHYFHKALDFRIPKNVLNKAKELKEMLGEDYDIVLEDTHVHVEFHPKN